MHSFLQTLSCKRAGNLCLQFALYPKESGVCCSWWSVGLCEQCEQEMKYYFEKYIYVKSFFL